MERLSPHLLALTAALLGAAFTVAAQDVAAQDYGRQDFGRSGGNQGYGGGQAPGGYYGRQGAPIQGTPTMVVQEASREATVTLGGTVVPFKDVTLAAQIPGRVVNIAGSEGDYFEEGEVLVELDDSELRAQQQAAWAALRDAEAGIRNAQTQYSRELIAPQARSPSTMPGMGMPTLFDQFFTRPMGSMMGQGSPGLERYSDLYGRQTQVEQAQNAYQRALAQLRQIETKFRDAKSIAPFDGVIVNKFVEEGDTAQPGQPLVKFADVRSLQIQVEVPARLMPVREGQVLEARLDVSDKPVKVRVARVFPMADPQRHTVTVKFDIQPGTPAAPGMYAEVMIPDNNSLVRNVIAIPTSALIQRGSLPMVQVANPDGGRELRVVRLGEYLDAQTVSVLSGLSPGEVIFIQGQAPLDMGPASGRRPY